VDCVGDVRPGKGKELESLDEVSVGCHIVDRGTVVVRDLCLSVNMRGAGLALHGDPRKWWRGLMSFIANSCCRVAMHRGGRHWMPYA
jgi:hypothetical protein